MKMMDRNEIDLRLNGLVIFRNLLKDPVLGALQELLQTGEEDTALLANRYGSFAAALFDKTTSWSR